MVRPRVTASSNSLTSITSHHTKASRRISSTRVSSDHHHRTNNSHTSSNPLPSISPSARSKAQFRPPQHSPSPRLPQARQLGNWNPCLLSLMAVDMRELRPMPFL